MEHVTTKELDKILKQQLSIRRCPKCGSIGPQIVIQLNFFKESGLKIECQNCDFGINFQDVVVRVADETRYATPITPKSIVRATYNAVNTWNKAAVFMRNEQVD